MALTIVPKESPQIPIERDTSGIALFMVLSAVSVLAIVVSEFTYISQISQLIAYGGLDQTRAHYIAKSGLKLSLLRLKVFQQIPLKLSAMTGGNANAVNSLVPKNLLNKIWSFPLIFPISVLPGMTLGDKTMLEKFQKESSLLNDGAKLTAQIESESSKYNLNLLLPGFASMSTPSPTPSPTASSNTTLNPQAQPNPTPTFNIAEAQQNLSTYLGNILQQKSESDPQFASLYRDYRLEDLIDAMTSWGYRTFERRTSANLDPVQMKRAPYYSISELHMLPGMDDDLYNLFAPNLTTNTTAGININTIQPITLHALIPQMTLDEITALIQYRDSEEIDQQFKSSNDFFTYLSKYVAAFKNNSPAIDQLKQDLANRGIHFVMDETQFKITVQGQVNNATRTIEAWVTLGAPTNSNSGGLLNGPGPQPSNVPPVNAMNPNSNALANSTTPPPDSGLKITFMKIF